MSLVAKYSFIIRNRISRHMDSIFRKVLFGGKAGIHKGLKVKSNLSKKVDNTLNCFQPKYS